MKLTKDEFKKLQQTWYKKLADNGFKDIEKLIGGELVLCQKASNCCRTTDEFAIAMKEEYFTVMYQMSQDETTAFRNETDKYILIRHSEGLTAKEIIKELALLGKAMHRHSIRFIIRKYEMAWGIKSYTNKQLNVVKYD